MSPVAVMLPEAVMLPPTSKFSLMFICVESLELKLVPSILTALATTPSVPDRDWETLI